MLKPVRGRALIWMAAVALVAAACGGDDGGGDDGGNGGGGGGATRVTVEGTEFSFSPAAVTVAADTDVSVTFDNQGSIDHEWTVLTAGTELASEGDFDASLVAFTIAPIPAGSSAEGTLNLPAGEYQVLCSIPGHFTAGMAGTLTVSSS